MKIAVADAPIVLVDYMEKHVLSKAAGLQKFAVGAAMFGLAHRAQGLVTNPQLVSTLKTLGVVGEDDLLDMDYARDMALDAMQKSGGKLPLMGYVLDASDIEAIYECAKAVA